VVNYALLISNDYKCVEVEISLILSILKAQNMKRKQM